MSTPLLDIPPCDMTAVARLERALGVAHPVAQILVRRGLDEPAAAEAWLAAEDRHDPALFAGIEAVCELILQHVDAGTPIVVHGDYDVDGVASTAILVGVLRNLGGQVTPMLPSRTEDGYGLSGRTVERLLERGTRLLITADCAITAVAEVAQARAGGMDVVVTDHHQPRADGVLPDAPIVHPAINGYPVGELCAAGVAHKLAAALLRAAGRDPAEADADLDLVALATVADCVPLVGENRRLVREGLRALASTTRPGLRALMRVTKVDPARVDARAVGFRLAPRLNAAGRLYRADIALELLMTTDAERAGQIAEELDQINAERRNAETRILFEAEAMVRDLGERPAYVLWGDGWHKGVIGIVASRIAERTHRPTLVIAMDGATGTGSGRSIPAFDLLRGLDACSAHLGRHGGHRAAAGCEVARDALEPLRAAFEAHAAAVLSAEDLVRRERVDAVVAGDELGTDLAEQLARLEPLGQGNPVVRLLVPAATLTDCRPLGETGKHVRCTLHAGGRRAQAIAFGRTGVPCDEPVDVVAELELNEWRGSVEPRLLVREVLPCAAPAIEVVDRDADVWDVLLAELTAPLDEPSDTIRTHQSDLVAVQARDRRGGGIAGVVGALVASGEPVLVVAADAPLRASQLAGRVGGFRMCSHAALRADAALAAGVAHLVLVDPPSNPAEWSVTAALSVRHMVHLAWGPAELTFTERIHEREYDLRAPLTALYRDLRALGGAGGEELEAALRGVPPAHRSPTVIGRALRVLTELHLVSLDPETRTVVVPPAQRTELERSEAFRAYTMRLEDGRRYLSSATPLAA